MRARYLLLKQVVNRHNIGYSARKPEIRHREAVRGFWGRKTLEANGNLGRSPQIPEAGDLGSPRTQRFLRCFSMTKNAF